MVSANPIPFVPSEVEGRAAGESLGACFSTSLEANGFLDANGSSPFVSSEVETRIWAALADVPDPEVPAVSVVDLGIVRAVSEAEVTITPTYSGCPATLAIEVAIRAALDRAGFGDTAIRTMLSPPWTTDWITPAGHAKLQAYGIAPPSRAATAECPRCGSTDTREVSRFGSTPCKAQWQCRACLEPFDRFKCH